MYNPTLKNCLNKLIITFSLSVFMFGCFQLDAQITIEENIFTDRIGKKYKEVLYETNLDIDGQLADIKAAIGQDQTWDFSNLNYIDSTVTFIEIMNIDPNDPFLMNPELANSQYINKITLLPVTGGSQDTSTTYVYTSLDNGIWTANGAFSLIDLNLDGNLDSALQFFLPPLLQVPFPVTSTSEWYDSTTAVNIFLGMEFISSTIIDSTWVEGYGTLITPYGIADALRVRNKEITHIPGSPFVDITNDLDFVTEDDKFTGSIVIEDGRAFYSVRTEIEGTSSTFDFDDIKFTVNQVSPNPSSDFLDVNITMINGDEVECSLISSAGSKRQLLKKDFLPSGNQNIRLSIDGIASGLYYLEVRSGRFIQHLPISKM